MSTLRIRVAKFLDGVTKVEYGVVASIHRISDGSRSTDPQAWDQKQVVVPISNSPDIHKDIRVGPGNYLVEATLPSGITLRSKAELLSTDDRVDVTLLANESPHEWLSWQQLGGFVESSPESYEAARSQAISLSRPESTRRKTTSSKRARRKKASGSDYGRYEGERSRISSSTQGKVRKPTVRMEILDLDMVDRQADFMFPVVKRRRNVQRLELSPMAGDEIADLYTFDRNTGSAKRRSFLTVDYPDKVRYFAALPIPWERISRTGSGRIEALVRRLPTETASRDFNTLNRVSVTVQDTIVSTLISYLGTGRLQYAAMLLGEAHDLLLGKRLNPIAAAAGGYVLMYHLNSDAHPDWLGWIGNLADWFEWLPDGAILNGWRILNSTESDDTVDRAGEEFLRAVRRGLPIFSHGVSLLRDGLEICCNELEEDSGLLSPLRDSLKMVKRTARYTSPRHPFTTMIYQSQVSE